MEIPELYGHKPEKIESNVTASAGLLGVSREQFIAAALKQAQLFCQKPDKLNDNVTASAGLMGVSREQFIAAALKKPQLFCQKPDTLNDNVTASAGLMGVSREQFIAAALKQPSLFYQKPDTLNCKKFYVMKIGDSLGKGQSFAALITQLPASLCYGANHLHARYVIGKLKLKKAAFSSLITLPSRQVTPLIVDYFTRQIAETGKGIRALQVMHAQGLIDDLPPTISPIQRPPRRPVSLKL